MYQKPAQCKLSVHPYFIFPVSALSLLVIPRPCQTMLQVVYVLLFQTQLLLMLTPGRLSDYIYLGIYIFGGTMSKEYYHTGK